MQTDKRHCENTNLSYGWHRDSCSNLCRCLWHSVWTTSFQLLVLWLPLGDGTATMWQEQLLLVLQFDIHYFTPILTYLLRFYAQRQVVCTTQFSLHWVFSLIWPYIFPFTLSIIQSSVFWWGFPLDLLRDIPPSIISLSNESWQRTCPIHFACLSLIMIIDCLFTLTHCNISLSYRVV